MDWSKIVDGLNQGTKQRLNSLDQLQDYVTQYELGREQVSVLVDNTPHLLSDNNFKVALRLLQVWEQLIERQGNVVKPFISNLIPSMVERLSDTRQEVRQAACNCMLLLLNVVRPDVVFDRLTRFWGHKHWKVRHGLLQFVAEAVCHHGVGVLAGPGRSVVSHVIRMLEDSESAVRDAALECLEELYPLMGAQLLDVMEEHTLRPAVRREVYTRLQADAAGEGDGTSMGDVQDVSALTRAPTCDDAASSSGNGAAAWRGAVDGGNALTQAPAPLGPEDSSASCVTQSTVSGRATRRRGGFNDGGGITAGGELAEAPMLVVAGERELRMEVERVQMALAPSADWEKRVGALLRLEGLIKGGAASHETFVDMLRPLKDLLAAQIADRRSAVARQVCHALGALAGTLGLQFESLGLALLPLLFKALPITVQVMSEASDTAVRTILHHCQSPKLLSCVCVSVTSDKNAKIRMHCSSYLLQVLEEWDPQLYTRIADQVEACILKAAQDHLADTRSFGRSAFGAYMRAEPDRATALLARAHPPLQAKLREGMTAYLPGANQAATTQPPQAARPPPAPPTRAALGARRAAAAAAAAAARSAAQEAAGAEAGGYAALHEVAAPAVVLPFGTPAAGALPPRPHSSRAGAMYIPAGSGAVGDAAVPVALQAPPSAVRLVASSHQGGVYRSARKGVATAHSAPQRVPGAAAEHTPDARVLEFMAEARTLQKSSRRTSVAQPLRVAQLPERPAATPSAPARCLSTGEAARLPLPPTPDGSAASDGVRAPWGAPPAARAAPAHLSRATSGSDDIGAVEVPGPRDQQWQAAGTGAAAGAGAATDAAAAYASGAPTPRGGGGGGGGGGGFSAGSAGAAGGGGGERVKPGAAVSKVVAAILAGLKTWSEKVERFNALTDLLGRQPQGGAGADIASELERVTPKLLAAMDDPHFKVALAAMATTEAALHACPRALEPSLERLLPLLFLRLVSSKAHMQAAAEALLQACAMAYSADALLPALGRALDAYKAPSFKNGVLEFWVLFIGEGKAAGAPAYPVPMRQWVVRVAPLLMDKAPEVRTMAAKVLRSAHAMDPALVMGVVAQAPADEALSMRRALSATDGTADAAAAAGLHAANANDVSPAADAGEEAPAAWPPAGGGQRMARAQSGHDEAAVAVAAHEAEEWAPPASADAWAAAPPATFGAFEPDCVEDAGGVASGLSSLALSHGRRESITSPPPPAAAGCAGWDAEGDVAALLGGGVDGGAVAGATPPSHERVPTDTQGQSRYLTVLVHRLQTRPSDDVLTELAAAAASVGEEAWDANFSKVLLAVLGATKAAHEPTREAAFVAIAALARHRAPHFLQPLEVALQTLLLGCADASREVLMAAHQALEQLTEAMPPDQVVDILRFKLPSPESVSAGTAADGDVLCAALRCLRAAMARMGRDQLLSRAPAELLPGLFAAYGHTRADVRRAVVLCLTEAWGVAGAGLTPYLSALSSSQYKLLTIYFDRAHGAAPRTSSGVLPATVEPMHGLGQAGAWAPPTGGVMLG